MKKKRKEEYWVSGFSIVIAMGVMLVLNTFEVTAGSIGFESGVFLGILGLVFAGALFLAGWLILQRKVKVKRKTSLGHAGVTTGLAFFFWGSSIIHTWKTDIGYGVGSGVLVVGIVLALLALEWAFQE
jgi:hypothetical protein